MIFLRRYVSGLGERCIGEVEESEEHDRNNDVDEEEEDEDVEEDEEEEEDEQEFLPVIEKHVTVFARWPNEVDWKIIGLGNLAICYDSEIYAERITLKLDESDEYASNIIIGMDAVMQVILFKMSDILRVWSLLLILYGEVIKCSN